jgi:hypothetical protein
MGIRLQHIEEQSTQGVRLDSESNPNAERYLGLLARQLGVPAQPARRDI